MRSAWHLLTMDGYIAGPFNTYRDATWEAQCRIGAEGRPARFAAGFYELTSPPNDTDGSASTYYICTTEMALRQGFDWIEEIAGANNEKEQA